jgi:hypothetical protein
MDRVFPLFTRPQNIHMNNAKHQLSCFPKEKYLVKNIIWSANSFSTPYLVVDACQQKFRQWME